jgi:hypothetical protein
MLSDESTAIENADRLESLADVYAATDELGRRRVTILVQVDVALNVNATAEDVVDFRDMERQRLEVRSFLGEELEGDRFDLTVELPRPTIDLVAPLSKLAI